MHEFLTTERVGFFLLFAVPGIIILYFRAQFMTGRLPSIAEGSVLYLTLSLIYQAAAYPITSKYLFTSEIKTFWHLLGWFTFIFLGPAVIGIFSGFNLRKGWIKSLVNKCGISTIHPIHCAWDWHFGQCRECWVIVVLKDGTELYGFLGKNSFMSSEPAERDLYIERGYTTEKEGNQWQDRGSSIWIAHNEIQYLEFLPKKN